jgi:nitroreductase
MDVLTAISTKRVVRAYAERPIEADHLRAILEAGRRAGSSKNQQRWDFIVVADRDRLARLADVGPYARHISGAAAVVALVTPDPAGPGHPLSVVWDSGGAAAQMMLAAWALGVGSCPVTVYEQDLARSILGYPDDRWCEYLIALGYPADPAVMRAPNRPGGRRPLDEIVHEETW